jgi:hypothetical protein
MRLFNDIIHKDNNFEISLISMKKLNKKYKSIKNWRYNRPVDVSRIKVIRDHLLINNYTLLPGIISAWETDNSLEIYDGFHRYSSAINLDIDLLIRITKTNDIKMVAEDFKNINQSISVPYLYLEENNITKRKVIESVVEKFCQNFPNNISPSRNCQPQNFNRDNFISILQNVDLDFFLPNIDVKIYQCLLGINNEAQEYIKNHKIKTPKKCDYYKLWLFYLDQSTIVTRIQELLQ